MLLLARWRFFNIFSILFSYCIYTSMTLPITSKPIDNTPENLAWEEWIQTHPKDLHNKTKKVTPKSIFIFRNRSTNTPADIQCPPDHKYGFGGKCIPTFKIDTSKILIQQLENIIATNNESVDYDYGEYSDGSPEKPLPHSAISDKFTGEIDEDEGYPKGDVDDQQPFKIQFSLSNFNVPLLETTNIPPTTTEKSSTTTSKLPVMTTVSTSTTTMPTTTKFVPTTTKYVPTVQSSTASTTTFETNLAFDLDVAASATNTNLQSVNAPTTIPPTTPSSVETSTTISPKLNDTEVEFDGKLLPTVSSGDNDDNGSDQTTKIISGDLSDVEPAAGDLKKALADESFILQTTTTSDELLTTTTEMYPTTTNSDDIATTDQVFSLDYVTEIDPEEEEVVEALKTTTTFEELETTTPVKVDADLSGSQDVKFFLSDEEIDPTTSTQSESSKRFVYTSESEKDKATERNMNIPDELRAINHLVAASRKKQLIVTTTTSTTKPPEAEKAAEDDDDDQDYWWLPSGWRVDQSGDKPLLLRFWSKIPGL